MAAGAGAMGGGGREGREREGEGRGVLRSTCRDHGRKHFLSGVATKGAAYAWQAQRTAMPAPAQLPKLSRKGASA